MTYLTDSLRVMIVLGSAVLILGGAAVGFGGAESFNAPGMDGSFPPIIGLILGAIGGLFVASIFFGWSRCCSRSVTP